MIHLLPAALKAISVAVFVVSLSALSVSCDDQPVVLTGRWQGANADFNDVTLALEQIRDSVAGTITLAFANPTNIVAGTLSSGRAFGDSLEVSAIVSPASTGYVSIGFAGHVIRTPDIASGGVGLRGLSGRVLLSGTPDSIVVKLFQQ